jgi:hypothetical protein
MLVMPLSNAVRSKERDNEYAPLSLAASSSALSNN